MPHDMKARPIEILLVEDSPSDTELTVEAFREAKLRNHLSVVEDGVEAMQFLRRQGRFANAPHPDLILLDLNLPRKDGREVLAELKADKSLATIPVVILTASDNEHDVLRAQKLRATSYVTKPVQFHRLLDVVKDIESFHVFIITLPRVSPGTRALA
jgi:chemotaxis family two-component system response regulator Rcp1